MISFIYTNLILLQDILGLVHKDSQGRQILTAGPQTISTSSTGRTGERRVIITTSGGSGEVKQVCTSILLLTHINIHITFDVSGPLNIVSERHLDLVISKNFQSKEQY